MTPTGLAPYFGVPLVDYRRAGEGVLVSSGCGIMLAIMDAVPGYRWCVDVDAMRELPPWRIKNFVTALDRNSGVTLLGLAGWFSLDKPEALKAAVAGIARMDILTYSGGYAAFADERATLAEFIDLSNQKMQAHGSHRLR